MSGTKRADRVVRGDVLRFKGRFGGWQRVLDLWIAAGLIHIVSESSTILARPDDLLWHLSNAPRCA